MRSSIFERLIKNSLTKEARKTILFKKYLFNYYYTGANANSYEDDASTIVRIIFDRYNPTIKSGINILKSTLAAFTLNDYNQNVYEILDAMQQYYN